MRSNSLARAVLRSAARNVPAAQRTVPRQLHAVFSSVAPAASAPLSVRSFSSSGVDLKKKTKKNALAAATDDELAFSEQGSQEAEFGMEEDDDLFGGISDSDSAVTATTSSSTSIQGASSMTRAEFAQTVESYHRSLEWEAIDRGLFPSLHKWRNLAGHACTQSELEQVLELAKLYRDRVGSLGVESGWVFAGRASNVGLPEMALNAFLDRYTFGLEYDMECLYLVQNGFSRKLNRRNRDEIVASAQLPGAPVQQEELLAIEPETSENGDVEGKQGEEGQRSRGNEVKHRMDLPFARAQLSLIDRMALVVTLSINFTPSSTASTSPIGSAHDPILLSYITRAYISTFKLASKSALSNPLLAKLLTRTDALISLLTLSAQRVLFTPTAPSKRTPPPTNPTALPPKRSAHLRTNLTTTLTYVAARGNANFKDPLDATPLDPVRSLYRYMDKVAPQDSIVLIRKIEPLLQRYST